MKKILALFLVFFTGIIFAENTIIALVNNEPISLHSLDDEFISVKTNEKKIEIINTQIGYILQLQKVEELNLIPSEQNINKVLLDIAKSNNITIDELTNFDDIDLIKTKISEKLSILNLQRYITQDVTYPKDKIQSECFNNKLIKDLKQIKVAQIIISEIDSELKDTKQQNILIKGFLNKLSTHISKGASFESFAKLHSQHPSYKDGGVSDWLTVNNPTLKMLDSLNTNEVSEIYSTIYGLAIAIKIDERFISSKLKECEEKIIYQNAEIFYADWLKNQREQAFIEIYYDKFK
ncbi:peptidylprolyl isomerase [Pseudothioglobus sp. nBUS_23]|uniref:peptidylprolyl isomerase n=1 Tax=Pseudothioglobus sp. nBUS_23 TaxID=3395318 RepID=UPI003EBAA68F